MTRDMEQAERALLKATSKLRDTKTSVLLAKVESKSPNLSGDTVRSAYWHLVNDGKLERTAFGVRKASR